MNWNQLKLGDIITLKDPRTILSMLRTKVNDCIEDLNLEVKEVQLFTAKTRACSWLLVTTDLNLSLIVKMSDSDFKIQVVFVPEGLPIGDRADWIEADCKWLFAQPSDDTDYTPASLQFTSDLMKDGVKFIQKHPTLFVDVAGTFGAIHEWEAETECKNPEIILFEIGGQTNERGGILRLFQGAVIAVENIEIL